MPLDTTQQALPDHAHPVWQQALASGDRAALLKLNAYHLSQYPKLAPTFSDLVRELRFADVGEEAKAAFIAEVLTALRDVGSVAARQQCWRALKQLRAEYARRHPTLAADICMPASPPSPAR
jgi:hypothetical protein